MQKASYTVEAAFIIPILLGIAFLIMYVLFLFHDKTILQGNLSYVLCKMAEEKDHPQEEIQTQISSGLWLVKVNTISVKRSMGKVTGKVTGTARVHIPVMSFFIKETQKILCTGEYLSIQPEQFQRTNQKETDKHSKTKE